MAAAGSTPPRCPKCGEVVGVYEPALSLTPDGTRLHGSRHGHDVPVVGVYHRDCLEPREAAAGAPAHIDEPHARRG